MNRRPALLERAGSAAAIATHSGLRGRPGIELTDELVADVVARFAALVARRGGGAALGLGRDERRQSRDLARHVAAQAVANGLDVVDFGVASTPTIKHACLSLELGASIAVTGSHLGPAWSGLKLAAAPAFLPVDIRELPSAEVAAGGSHARGRVTDDRGAAAIHAAAIAAAIDTAAIGSLSFAVRGGAGTDRVLRGIGWDREDAHPDLTLCLDADGDRLTLIDERGEALDPELTLVLASLAARPESLVKGADSSRMVDLVSGSRVHVTRPGELHLLRELEARGSGLAGEGNGGVVVPEVGMARDGLAAAALLLGDLAAEGRPLSSRVAELPTLHRVRSTTPCAGALQGAELLERMAATLGAGISDPEEGLHVEDERGAWGLVRRSATEPVLRFTVEAGSEAAAEALHRRLRSAAHAGSP